jgi:hypothetical protein
MFQGGPTVMMELQVTVAFGAFKYLFQQKSMSDIEKEYQGDGGSDDISSSQQDIYYQTIKHR